MKLTTLMLPALVLGLSEPLSADTWSYAECVEYAREHNIDLQKSRLSGEAAAYTLDESKGLWQPTLDFSTSHGFTNSPWGMGNRNSYSGNYELSAAWTVWNGGVRENTISRDKLLLDRSRLTTGALFRSLETDLLQVYINLLYAREAINICESAEQLSAAQADRGRQLMKGGRMSRVDYAQLASQWEQDKYATVAAKATYETRCMELKQLLQLGLDSTVEPSEVDWSDEQVLASLPPMDESYALARSIDLQIEGLELDRRAADYDVRIAQAGRLPKISLSASAGTGSYSPGEPFGVSMKRGLNERVGVAVSVPILDGRRTRTATARAKIAREEAQLSIDDRETQLQQTIENWYTDTSSAQSRYRAAISQLSSASLTDSLTAERFSLGYINPVELLTAHNSLTEARHAVLQAKCMAMLGQKMIQYYRTAKVEIN